MKKENLHKGQQDLIDAVLDEARFSKVKFIQNFSFYSKIEVFKTSVLEPVFRHRLIVDTQQDTILVNANH